MHHSLDPSRSPCRGRGTPSATPFLLFLMFFFELLLVVYVSFSVFFYVFA